MVRVRDRSEYNRCWARENPTLCQVCGLSRWRQREGLCKVCYQRHRRQAKIQAKAQAKAIVSNLSDDLLQALEDAGQIRLCGLCAEPKPIYARDMCRQCYWKWQRRIGSKGAGRYHSPPKDGPLPPEQEAERLRRLAEYVRQVETNGELDYQAAQRLP